MHAISSHSLLAYGTLWLSISHEGLSCNQHRKDIPPSPGQWEDLLRTPLWGGSFYLSTVGESHLYWTLLVPQVPLLYWAAILQLLWPLTAKGPQLQRFWRICFTQEAVPCLVACSQWLSDVVWKASLWPPSRRCSRQNLLCGVLFMFQSSCRVRLTLDHN